MNVVVSKSFSVQFYPRVVEEQYYLNRIKKDFKTRERNT